MVKFSVVIAVYNKERYISETLESVLKQSYVDFEVVIVNDGSSDQSEARIKAFNDSRISYYYQENQGAGAARNAAISKATAPFIALLDADDYWHPDYLSEVNQLIDQYPNEAVYATGIAIQNKGKTSPSVYSISQIAANETRVLDFFESSYINSLLTSSSTVLKKEVIATIGLYDPTIKSGQDTDLWIRIGLQYKVVFLHKSLATYRYAQSSLSNTLLQVADKPSFEKYEALETENKGLKKYLDLNRFSLAILAKRTSNKNAFRYNLGKIDLENLNSKQRLLLRMPSGLIKSLHSFKGFLEKIGISLSAFN